MAAARVLVHKIQHYERMRSAYEWSGWLQARIAHIKRLPFYLSMVIVTVLVFGDTHRRPAGTCPSNLSPLDSLDPESPHLSALDEATSFARQCGEGPVGVQWQLMTLVIVKLIGLVQAAAAAVALVSFVLIDSPLLALHEQRAKERSDQEVAGSLSTLGKWGIHRCQVQVRASCQL